MKASEQFIISESTENPLLKLNSTDTFKKNPVILAEITDLFGDRIPAWYGTNESGEEAIIVDFGDANTALVSIHKDDGPIGYISGFLEEIVLKDILNRPDLPPSLPNDTWCFSIHGGVVAPQHRGKGVFSNLFTQAIGASVGIVYFETRETYVPNSIAGKFPCAYLQFGFQRLLPEWAECLRTELAGITRYFWQRNLDYIYNYEGYKLPEAFLKCYLTEPGSIYQTFPKRTMPLHVYAPNYIPRTTPKPNNSRPFYMMELFLKRNPDVYSPFLLFKKPSFQ